MSQALLSPSAPPGGWTLIELLVVLSLATLLLALSLPPLQNFVQRRRLDGLSAQLVSDLQFLRSSAVAQRTKLRLRVQSTPGGSCYLIHSGPEQGCSCTDDGSSACRPGAELLRLVYLPGMSGLRVQYNNVTSLLVDPRQGTVSPAGTIELSQVGGASLRHVVNNLGRVRVCAATAWPGLPTC